MGHKVHPYGLRIPIVKTWHSRWFARDREFARWLHEDLKIRQHIKQELQQAGISKTEIERTGQRVRIILHTARPGVIIGRRGADIDRLRDELQQMTNKEVVIDIQEVRNPHADAQLISDNIAFQLMKRIHFRRTMKKAIQLAMAARVQGIKVRVGGRLEGAELKRHESYRQGKIPLSTLRADIDYGFSEALTTWGLIGVKVWTYKGDVRIAKATPPSQPGKAAAPHGPVS